jgi:1-acyl-sn-glycerol-3-phosphate acyltransferase
MSGFLLVSCSNILLVGRPNFVLSVCILMLGGAGASFIMVTLDSLLQRMTPNSLRANVFGARGIVTNSIFLLSLVIVGKLLTIVSAFSLFACLGIFSLVVSGFIYLSEGDVGYRILRGLVRFILCKFYDLRVEGIENLPVSKRVILAGNHTSVLDGLIVMAAYPHKVYFLVAESIFERKILGFIARQLGFIPVNRGGFNKEAIREAVRILTTRHTLGVFPEGKISDDENLIVGKKGVAVIAKRTQTPIVPFAIEGAYYAWPKFKKYPQRHPVQIRFGSPLDITTYQEPQGVVDEVMQEIKNIKIDMEKEGLLDVEPNIIVRHIINF